MGIIGLFRATMLNYSETNEKKKFQNIEFIWLNFIYKNQITFILDQTYQIVWITQSIIIILSKYQFYCRSNEWFSLFFFKFGFIYDLFFIRWIPLPDMIIVYS